MFEITNNNADINFINKVIKLFGSENDPTSLDINVDSVHIGRFSVDISGNRDGEWIIHENSIYPGEFSSAKKYKYEYTTKKWYKLEDEEEFEEVD